MARNATLRDQVTAVVLDAAAVVLAQRGECRHVRVRGCSRRRPHHAVLLRRTLLVAGADTALEAPPQFGSRTDSGSVEAGPVSGTAKPSPDHSSCWTTRPARNVLSSAGTAVRSVGPYAMKSSVAALYAKDVAVRAGAHEGA